MVVNILYDGQLNEPEIELSCSLEDIQKIALRLMSLESSLQIDSIKRQNSIYPCLINSLIVKNSGTENDNDLLNINLENNDLIISGNQIALCKLGQSLINYFDDTSEDGDHLHLDYFEGNQLIAPTPCHLIVYYDSSLEL